MKNQLIEIEGCRTRNVKTHLETLLNKLLPANTLKPHEIDSDHFAFEHGDAVGRVHVQPEKVTIMYSAPELPPTREAYDEMRRDMGARILYLYE
jgi:hypothetical protein